MTTQRTKFDMTSSSTIGIALLGTEVYAKDSEEYEYTGTDTGVYIPASLLDRGFVSLAIRRGCEFFLFVFRQGHDIRLKIFY